MIDLLNQLPYEIYTYLIIFLSINDIINLSLASLRLYNFVCNNYIYNRRLIIKASKTIKPLYLLIQMSASFNREAAFNNCIKSNDCTPINYFRELLKYSYYVLSLDSFNKIKMSMIQTRNKPFLEKFEEVIQYLGLSRLQCAFKYNDKNALLWIVSMNSYVSIDDIDSLINESIIHSDTELIQCMIRILFYNMTLPIDDPHNYPVISWLLTELYDSNHPKIDNITSYLEEFINYNSIRYLKKKKKMKIFH